MKTKIKSLIGPFILFLIIMAGILVTALYQDEPEPVEVIKVNGYEGPEEDIVLENDKLIMRMDSTSTQFSVEVKEKWSSLVFQSAGMPLMMNWH